MLSKGSKKTCSGHLLKILFLQLAQLSIGGLDRKQSQAVLGSMVKGVSVKARRANASMPFKQNGAAGKPTTWKQKHKQSVLAGLRFMKAPMVWGCQSLDRVFNWFTQIWDLSQSEPERIKEGTLSPEGAGCPLQFDVCQQPAQF